MEENLASRSPKAVLPHSILSDMMGAKGELQHGREEILGDNKQRITELLLARSGNFSIKTRRTWLRKKREAEDLIQARLETGVWGGGIRCFIKVSHGESMPGKKGCCYTERVVGLYRE